MTTAEVIVSVSGTLGSVFLALIAALGKDTFTKNIKSLFVKSKSNDVIMHEFIEINDSIYDSLKEIRDKLNLAKVHIIEFHNGDYINERSLKKYSMTYEVNRPGKERVKKRYQNRPLDEYLNILKQYYNNKFVKIDKDNPNVGQDDLDYMQYQGYNGVICLGLFKNEEDRYPRAVISCAYDDDSDIEHIEEELMMHSHPIKENLFRVLLNFEKRTK